MPSSGYSPVALPNPINQDVTLAPNKALNVPGGAATSHTIGPLILSANGTVQGIGNDIVDYVRSRKGVAAWNKVPPGAQLAAIPAAPVSSAIYMQADQQAMVDAINALRAALTAYGFTA